MHFMVVMFWKNKADGVERKLCASLYLKEVYRQGYKIVNSDDEEIDVK